MIEPRVRPGLALAMVMVLVGQAQAQELPEPLPDLPLSAPMFVGNPSPIPRTNTGPGVLIPVEPGVATTQPLTPIDPITLPHGFVPFARLKARSCVWRQLQGKFLGYPEEFRPRPLGAAMYQHGQTMVSNGTAATMTLFNYDFVPDSGELTPRGRYQLAKIVDRLGMVPNPVVIEPTPRQPELAEARRVSVLSELALWSVPLEPERVVVARPRFAGLSPTDGTNIANIFQVTTQRGGATVSSPTVPQQVNGAGALGQAQGIGP